MICVHSLRRGGAERVVLEVAKGLMERGHQVLVVGWVDINEYPDSEYQNIAITSLTSQSDYAWLRSIPAHSKRLRAICRDFRPDVVQVHTPNVMWLVAYARLKVKTYHILHGYGELDAPTSFRLGFRRIGLKLAHAFAKASPIVVAPSMRNLASQLFCSRADLKLICNGIDIDLFDGSSREYDRHPAAKDFTILMVGTLTPNKGQHHGINAFKKLHETMPNSQLLIVGEGSARDELKAMIADQDLKSHVRLLGLRRDIPSLMVKANVLWQLSKTEAAPMVVAEAMASGTPVVGFDVRGINDLVVQDETGLLVQYGDLGGIVSATNRLSSEIDFWMNLSKRSRKIAAEKYSKTEMINLYEELN